MFLECYLQVTSRFVVCHKALRYEDDYQGALDCFDRACALDPTWREARDQEKALWQALTDIRNLIDLKGKLKTKRFNSLVDSLSSKSLGPYGGGSYTGPSRMSAAAAATDSASGSSSSSSSSTVRLEEVPFSGLKEGLNAEKVTLGRVICSVHSEDQVPL